MRQQAGMLLGEAVASTSGRASPALQLIIQRTLSLVASGIPSPRADVALQLSTPHGGHINRMINTSESIVELDSILYRFRKRLRPANIGAAAMRLEHLNRLERRTPYALRVQRVAAELQKYVATYTDRLALTQAANVLRGLSAVRHRLPPELVLRLAAGAVADGGAALRLAPDVDVRDLCFGLAGQGFNNTAFWARLCAAVLPRLRSFDPNTLPALVTALQAAQQLPAPASASASSGSAGSAVAAAAGGSTPQAAVAAEALRLLSRSETLAALAPARLADAASLLAGLGPALGVAVDARLVEAVQTATARALPSLSPNQLPGLLLAVAALRRAAAPAEAAAAAAATAPQQQLPAALLATALPHLSAGAVTMDLTAVMRAARLLAPHAAEPAAADTLVRLARRTLLLLPAPGSSTGGPTGSASGSSSSNGEGLVTLSRVPRGGQAAGAVLAAAAPAGQLQGRTAGAVEGVARAFAAAAPAVAPQPALVGELAARLAAAGEAAAARGLLDEAQLASLGRSVEVLAAAGAAKSG
ncbi:hypothetical protein CHLRE_03g179901v5 [Chlamydomonas reinhardtii]|uniref:Uncharacterized protein n=1 Tax=Chlamydomonas reinhardtii TaxID=3055 RepID=A0A2K3DXQ3_CHLRE|nr:uncharacterized protein CHLRE_03g179901v5 [Chlamydomonas reinhardtii]PNW85297.1 hypothetical protein CHLRE_03g179901v5 [Chlamydomonas reinhardtii]7PKT_P Chain P, mL116 [Chlamydomonas reinhardtii]